MRNLKKLLAVIVAICVLASFTVPAFAATSASFTYADQAKKLYDMKLYAGNSATSYVPDLGSKLTREQGIILLVRMFGKEKDALAMTDADTVLAKYTDAAKVSSWAKKYVAYAVKTTMVSGTTATTLDAAGKLTGNAMATMILKNLGFTVDPATYATNAATLSSKGGLTADEATKFASKELIRDDVVGIMFGSLKAKDSNGKVVIDNLVASGAVSADAAKAAGVYTSVALDVSSAVAINSKVVEVSLGTAATAADLTGATVKDSAGKDIAVSKIEFAPWATDSKSILVTLGADTTAGSYYTLTFGTKSVNFGGRGIDTGKPTVSTITPNEYNEVKVTFSEPVKLDGATFVITEKYGTKAALAVSNMKYDGSDAIILTTAEQKGATLYGIEVSAVKDFADLTMDKDSDRTFVGIAKDTSDLKVSAAGGNIPEEAVVEFNVSVDPTTIAAANFKVEEMYGSKTVLPVTAARAAKKTDDKGSNGVAIATDAAAKKAVIITVPGTKTSTLYKVTVTGMKSAYGKAQSSTTDDTFKTFVGVAKPTDAFAYGSPAVTVNSNTEIEVKFARKVDKTLAETIANYAVAEAYAPKTPLTVTAAVLKSNGDTVKLTVSSMKNTLYTIVATNLKDIYGNAIKTESDSNKINFVGQSKQDKISKVTVTRINETHILLDFNRNVGSSYKDISHYSIDGGVGYPTKAESVDGQPTQVKLTIPKTTEGTIYKITVKGLENADGVAMDADGVNNTFVGKGNAVGLVTIQGISTLDKNAFELFFDRAVDASTVADLIWDTSTTTLGVASKTTVQIKKGSGSFAGLSGHIAYKDPANNNGLIIRYNTGGPTITTDIQSSTNEVVTIKFTSNFIKDAASGKEFTFASSNADPAAPKLIGVQAENKYSALLYFDQPMKASTVVKANIDVIDAKGAAQAVVVADGTSEVVKVNDTTFRYYTADMTSPTPVTADDDGMYYLRLSSAVKNAGGIAIAKESDSDSNHYALLGINTGNADNIDSIYAIMTDKRTIEVHFPTAMNSSNATTIGNYHIVDSDNAAITGAPSIKWIKYDSENNIATLYLGGDMPTSTKGHYIVVSNNINTLITGQSVKNAGTYGSYTGVRTQAALSGTDAAAPKIASATVSADKKKLTIVMDAPVAFGTDTDGSSNAADTAADDVVLNTTAGLDSILLAGTTDGTIPAANFFEAFKVDATLTNAGAVTLSTTQTTANIDFKKDGKTIVITLASDTFKPGTSGTVSTDVAIPAAPAPFTRLLTATLVEQKTGSDKSAATFGVEEGYAFDTTAPTVVGAESLDVNKDGIVETIKVMFSENVNDSTLTTAAWNSHVVSGLQTAANLALSSITDTSNDNIVYLAVTGISTGTASIGTLTTNAAGGIKDLNGNPLATGVSQLVADKAAPVVLVGANTKMLSITTFQVAFSESVTVATAGTEFTDFKYDADATGVGAPVAFAVVSATTGSSTITVTTASITGYAATIGTATVDIAATVTDGANTLAAVNDVAIAHN